MGHTPKTNRYKIHCTCILTFDLVTDFSPRTNLKLMVSTPQFRMFPLDCGTGNGEQRTYPPLCIVRMVCWCVYPPTMSPNLYTERPRWCPSVSLLSLELGGSSLREALPLPFDSLVSGLPWSEDTIPRYYDRPLFLPSQSSVCVRVICVRQCENRYRALWSVNLDLSLHRLHGITDSWWPTPGQGRGEGVHCQPTGGNQMTRYSWQAGTDR